MNKTMGDADCLKNLTVLYVEDQEDARVQFTRFLERLVGQLLVAENGAEGLNLFMANHPQIIITDILMPVMDGLVMSQEIRKIDRSVQIIVLTAFEQIDYLKSAINIGVNKYVTKPVNGVTLYKTMLECVVDLRSLEQLKDAARTDLLTGLANRRELEIRFSAEKGRAERNGIPFSVIIADIDFFKRVNDTYGHLAGDHVLKAVADALVGCIRTEDFCCRWGGEEFLLLLASTNLEAAAIVAEKLRQIVFNLEIPWEWESLRVTVSLGVSTYKPGMDRDECIRLADEAMFRAKAAGRNRVELSEV